MVEVAVFLAVIFLSVFALGAVVVKLYEWRQDVLYGPYLRPDDPSELHIDPRWTMRKSRASTPLEKLGRERSFLRAQYGSLLRLKHFAKLHEREPTASSPSKLAKLSDRFRH